MRIVLSVFLLIIMACSGVLSLHLATLDIPGIHSPLPIDPLVDIPDDRFLIDLYSLSLVLNACGVRGPLHTAP
jgi:hypothetical protein